MGDLQNLCASVRLLVDDPLPNKPTLRRVLQEVVDQTQVFYSRIENGGAPWSLKSDYILTVSPNTQDFLLAIDDTYGKPIQVVSYYPTNPSYIPRLIEFREFADMYFDWSWPQNIAQWMWTDGSPNTAMRMAFYGKDDGSRWVRVLPQPALEGSYLITFASGDWAATAGISQSPVLSQFHSLIETWSAIGVLSSCSWWTGSGTEASARAAEAENRAKRKELFTTLDINRARYEEEFDRYLRNTIQDTMGSRASSMDHDDYGTWGGWY